MRRNKSFFIGLGFVFIAVILWGVNLSSSTMTIYGPRKFIRATGKPVVVKETFSAPDATAHYNLIVFNGEKGKNRVSSATIKINGIEILRESDFNQQVDRIERSVSLLLSNSISVELKSAPGSFITIAIECIDCLVITNHPPVAQDQSMTTDEDVPKAITLIAMDPDDDPVTYQIVAQPAHGTLSGAPPSLTYTPIAHYFGSDSFTFKANDGKLDSNIARVSITVTHVNHPPVAQDQSVTADEDVAKAIILVAMDPDGDPLTFQIVAQPTHGALSGTPPSLTYTPIAHYFGSDSFAFKANDGKLDSNIAAVSIIVTHVNHPPVAQNQSVTADKDVAKAITLSANDPDGDPLTYQIVAQPEQGTLSGTPPSVTYTSAAHYLGFDSFTFKANDGKVDSIVATVSITVRVNHPPVAQNQCVYTDEDTAKSITLSVTDVDGDPLTYTIVTQPAHGTLSGTPPSVAYTPAAHYFGRDSFTFKANDDNADSNVATVSVSVTPVIGINVIITVAGNGEMSYGGDGGLATKARLLSPSGVAVDTLGNLYIADEWNNRIRKVDKNGIITTVAGIGGFQGGYSGDGGPAVQAELNRPEGVALDTLGNLYIAEYENDSIRKVDTNGIITTVAGGTWGFGGDGGPATTARLNGPSGVAVDTLGNLYIADWSNQRIRKVDADGIITTVAGNGIRGYSGDGGPATTARLNDPSGVAVDTLGNLYIAEYQNDRIRKVSLNGIITTVAGNGTIGYSGDGGPATQAQLMGPRGVAVDTLGNLQIADLGNDMIRKVDTNGIITTVAGSREYGDGGPATEGNLYMPIGVAVDACSNLYVADNYHHRVRKVDADGIITTVAGNGIVGYSGDGGPATGAQLYYPSGIAVDTLGNLYIADEGNHRVRKVDLSGIISTLAGNGIEGYSGDGGPATQAMLLRPEGIAVDASGNVYIADHSPRIRKVDTNGIISTFAGNAAGFGGDGGPAIQAQMASPTGVALDASGNVYIADTGNSRIRKVDTNGIITTVAGNGDEGYSGDGLPATEAQLLFPLGVAVDASGNLYIADYYNDRIRKVDTNGIITTVAGNGMEGYSGDGGPANKAQLALPQGVTVDASGNLCIADTDNNRIRKVVGLSKGATIIGKITDSSTHMPLSEVTVVIKDSLNTFQTKTDLNGICIVSGMIPGSFTARFGMPGYIEQTVNGTLVSGQTKTLDIQLTPIPPLILTITSPPDGAVLSSSPITVIGNVSNDANLTVNSIQGSVINNTFSVSIPLSNGLNIITVTASDQYGQTASQSLSVILSTGGVIVGTVTDSSTGLSLPAATVSVTDIVGAKAALTDSEGGYIVYNVSPGAFSGSIRKDGYGTYNFSGTVAFGQIVTINAALAPILPVISDIAVSEITANSAAISWATDQLSDSLVEYGTTTFYGSSIGDSTLTTAHAVILNNLMPATTYHFRVTSTNGYGLSASSGDLVFDTSIPPITLVITYPWDGGTMNVRDSMVQGIVINSRGSETGVVVNGILANIYGVDFVVNHVPLVEGSNTITAIATDIDGNKETALMTVNRVTTGNYIRITSTTESGLSPLEATLTLESSLDLATASVTYAGPAEVEFLSTSTSEYRVRMVREGIYFFIANIVDSSGNFFNDIVAITVLPTLDLDGLLRGKWEAMRAKLVTGDIEGALVSFDEFTKQDYRDLFNVLSTILPTVAQEMSDIELVEYVGDAAIYDIRSTREGIEYSFQLLFTRDMNGIWRINSF